MPVGCNRLVQSERIKKLLQAAFAIFPTFWQNRNAVYNSQWCLSMDLPQAGDSWSYFWQIMTKISVAPKDEMMSAGCIHKPGIFWLEYAWRWFSWQSNCYCKTENVCTCRSDFIPHRQITVVSGICFNGGSAMQVTQEKLYNLIPPKAGKITTILRNARSMAVKQALLTFYKSKAYRLLEQEKTKLWYSTLWTLDEIRTNNGLERIMKEIRRRTRVVGSFPDGYSAMMLVGARLRHSSTTKWGTRQYLCTCKIYEQGVI